MSGTSILAGTVLAQRFFIENIAGSGGMGTVFRARDLHTGQPVALKLLHSKSNQLHERERFAREAQLLAELKHPRIVSYVVHGYTQEDHPFLAMEWLDGSDLGHFVEQRRLTFVECLSLLRGTASALAAAHRDGVVHRDLKPSNLFLRNNEIEGVTLIDFGIARRAAESRPMTRTGAVIGTPEYMAPEQARGQRDINPSADIFSLGCILFECLTGRRAFAGGSTSAVLIKILFENPPSLLSLCPGCPQDLADLITRMLAKEPDARHRDGMELLAHLDTLSVALRPEVVLGTHAAVPQALVHSEQVLVSVVVARPIEMSQDGLLTLDEQELQQARARSASLTRVLTRHGMQVEWLADGSLVATLALVGNAMDQATLAARGAAMLKEQWPKAEVALATGRSRTQDSHPLGDAIERAARLLRFESSSTEKRAEHLSNRVLLDDVTAGLVDTRFNVQRVSSSVFTLHTERSSVDESRRLLGKPTPCVGRERELSILTSTWAACCEDSVAGAVIVIAPPGVGKSRLRHEFMRQLQRPRGTVLMGQGDPMSAGSSYGLLGQALRRLCGILDGEPPSDQQSKLRSRLAAELPAENRSCVEFLGELCGVPFSDKHSVKLRAARQDPRSMSDQVNSAFVHFVRAECRRCPVLLVLEDLQWGDILTVRLVDSALRELNEQPLMVLALARTEVAEIFPGLWQERSVQELRLGGLSRKASERLIFQFLGSKVSQQTVSHLIERSAGNALYLEELIRAWAEGKGESLPETLLAIIQARLLRMEPGARRVLRAASLFGQTFWRGGVIKLLGLATKHELDELDGWLQVLTDAEVIERRLESKFPDNVEYSIRHAVIREAAYSMLTDKDGIIGHSLAGRYLESIGEHDPMVLAEHFQRGDEPERAVIFYTRAAEQALDGNDLDGSMVRATRGITCGARAEALGTLRSLQAWIHVWRYEWGKAYPLCEEGLDLLPEGSYQWCKTLGNLFTVTSLMGQKQRFSELVATFVKVNPADDALGAYAEAGSLLVTMFSILGLPDQASAFLSSIEQAIAPCVRESAAWVWHNLSRIVFSRMLGADPWNNLIFAQSGGQLCQKTGSLRNFILVHGFCGMAHGELGDFATGEDILRSCLEQALGLREPLLIVHTKIYLASILVSQKGRIQHEEARDLAAGPAANEGGNALHTGQAKSVLAHAFLKLGNLPEAEAAGRTAYEFLSMMPAARFYAAATLLTILEQQGRSAEAKALADIEHERMEQCGCAGYAEVACRLAIVKARFAAGDEAGARIAMEGARHAVLARSSKILDPFVRARFLSQVPENAYILGYKEFR